ncbi:MAG TPA: endolytic transglycosylase MltG [Chloroflexota bacterium]
MRRLAALVTLVAAVVLVWFLVMLFQPFGSSGHGRVAVTIPKGSSVSQIASLLERDGVISSGFFFELRAAIDGDRSKLRAGYYVLKEGMSYSAALDALTSQPGLPPTLRLTIIPARSRRQVQVVLQEKGVKGNYVRATVRSPWLDPTRYGAPRNTPSLEGFLWPDTYDLRRPAKMGLLIKDQLERFKQEFANVNFKYSASKNLTQYDVLKIASLISQEAMLPKDLPKAASVIYNRLRLGMELGLDSTVAYATGNYGTLTEKDLHSRSPWNTTNHLGLPPTPINSPGLEAINAAAHPAHTGYLYFINKVCGNGALRFTSSYHQFLGWSDDWNRAVAEAARNHGDAEFCKGGKP